jgi:hypothetical protein
LNVWEDGTKHELSEIRVLALKTLGIGYPFIRPDHGVVLRSYGLCYLTPPSGWRITDEGRKCLEVWDAGYDYDFTAEDRRHGAAPGRKAPPEVS